MVPLLRKKCSDVTFLALCVWREARGQTRECQEAVAMCVMNRIEKPGWWGKDVVSVVFRKWQFSSLTDPKDRQLTKWPDPSVAGSWKAWELALDIADRAIYGKIDHPAPGADSFWSDDIQSPYWANDENFVRKIGRISFHNVDMEPSLVTEDPG